MDRDFPPANEMMRKLFDRFLDRPGSGARELADAVGVAMDQLLPVRLVSHHMRQLGVLARKDVGDWLVQAKAEGHRLPRGSRRTVTIDTE